MRQAHWRQQAAEKRPTRVLATAAAAASYAAPPNVALNVARAAAVSETLLG